MDDDQGFCVRRDWVLGNSSWMCREEFLLCQQPSEDPPLRQANADLARSSNVPVSWGMLHSLWNLESFV